MTDRAAPSEAEALVERRLTDADIEAMRRVHAIGSDTFVTTATAQQDIRALLNERASLRTEVERLQEQVASLTDALQELAANPDEVWAQNNAAEVLAQLR